MAYFQAEIYEDMAARALAKVGLTARTITERHGYYTAYFDKADREAVRLCHNRIYNKGSKWIDVSGWGEGRDGVTLTFRILVEGAAL